MSHVSHLGVYGIILKNASILLIKKGRGTLGMIYLIASYDDQTLIHEMDSEDSLGACWYPLSELTENILSPFAHQAIRDLAKLA